MSFPVTQAQAKTKQTGLESNLLISLMAGAPPPPQGQFSLWGSEGQGHREYWFSEAASPSASVPESLLPLCFSPLPLKSWDPERETESVLLLLDAAGAKG